jgi:hypothetical protein
MRKDLRRRAIVDPVAARFAAGTLVALLLAIASTAQAQSGASDTTSDLKLQGGAEGTVFGTLTILGEDRISIEFDRPELSLDLDPREAPGLEWGDPLGVLQRSGIDLVNPFLAASAAIPSRGLADDWIAIFRDGPVARFRPALEDVESWRLSILDSRSDTVAVFEGRGEPPKEIAWNGLRLEGRPAVPGLVYSYVLEASDRAGNRRTFPGDGFELPSYRVREGGKTSHLFAARSLPENWALRPGGTPPLLLLEVASRINRDHVDAPVEVRVGARSFAEANALAEAIGGVLRERLLGDPARIRAVTDVRPDAPDGGTVAVVTGPAA